MTAEVLPDAYTNGNAPDGHLTGGDALDSTLPSAYLKYLPGIYQQDSFLGRFLRIFEDILSPIQNTVNRRSAQFDPSLAPDAMLEFLASWVGADNLGGVPEPQVRQLVRKAITLHQWRGTHHGLRMALEVVTNRRPYITEYSPGLVLGEDAILGLNTSLQEGQALQFHVLFDCREDEVDAALVHAIIRRYKPAAAVYSLSYTS
jgi:phage tail-like protein